MFSARLAELLRVFRSRRAAATATAGAGQVYALVLPPTRPGSHRGLHAAKLLLADEELYAVEDIIAEEDDADGRVAALITLSGKMAGDGAFARQLRRKYA